MNMSSIRARIQQDSTGTKVKHTSPKKVGAITVGLPPLPLQQQFAAIVEKIEAQKSRYRTQLAELDTLFLSLQSRAFKGELSSLVTLQLPTVTRKPLKSSEEYLVALISGYLQNDESMQTIAQLTEVMSLLSDKQDNLALYTESIGADATVWLETHCDTLKLEDLKDTMQRLIEHHWISISPNGELTRENKFKEPQNSEWAHFDASLTLSILTNQSNLSQLHTTEHLDLRTLYQSA